MLTKRVAGHVRNKSQDHGRVVILDATAGEWITLNETAGDLWRCWDSGAEFDRCVDDVAGRYPGVPREAIAAHARRLRGELAGRGIIGLTPSPAPGGATAVMAVPAAGPAGRLHVLAALLALGLADVLGRCSFRMPLALVRLTRRGWCHRAPTPGQARATVAAVSRAARWYPGRAACLEQSLAAVLLAAAGRRRLDWCLGSVPDPYRFHAWVAVAGQPVLAPGDDLVRTEYDLVLAA